MSPITLLVAATILFGGAARSPTLPADLRRVADAHACREIGGYYDEPGVRDPLYVYGFAAGERELSAAFWCERTPGRFRVLIAVDRGRSSIVVVDSVGMFGGLRLEVDLDEPLSSFRFADDGTSGPASVRTTGAVLRSELDGVYTQFYRHRGRWLLRMVD